MTTGIEGLANEIKDLARRLEKAGDAANDGYTVDLSGLDAEVSSLCRRATALKSPKAREFAEPLAMLIPLLDRIAEAMETRKAEAESLLRGESKNPRTASAAYGRSGRLR